MKKNYLFLTLFISFTMISFYSIISVTAATITSVSPEFVESGDIITINGSGFGSGYLGAIYLDSAYLLKISWSSTRITAYAPSYFSDMAQVKLDIYDSENYTSEIVQGPYVYPKPSITLVSPSEGKVGESIQIRGNGFGSQKGKVIFGGSEGMITSWTNTLIKVTIPDNVYSNILKVKIKKIGSTYETAATAEFKILKGVSNDTYSHYQTYLHQVKVIDAWNTQSFGNSNVVVAVIDDGVYENHPDLIGAMWRNFGETIGDNIDNDNNGYIDDYYGWNFLGDNADLTTQGEHGTRVAGIIGAIKDNNRGITGIAPGVKIMPLIVCDTTGGCTKEAIIDAIKYATDMGVDIINLSLGRLGTLAFSSDYNEVIEYAFNRGVLIVTAAGNGDPEGDLGQNLNFIKASPVCNDNEYNMVLGVAAVDNNNQRPFWSSHGSSCVDIFAPGEDMISTSVFNYTNADYTYGSGTSFSAPMVSGIAALIKSKYPELKNWEIMSKLISTATGGIVDADAAIGSSVINGQLSSISPSFVNVGDKVTLKGQNFSTSFLVRLIGSEISYGILSSEIDYKGSNTAIITIPTGKLPSGLYDIKLYKNNGSTLLSSLNNALTIQGGVVNSSPSINMPPSTESAESTQGLIGLNELQSFVDVTTNNQLGLRSNWLIKNNKFAEVFWADSNMCLHWIINEEIAERNFGVTWNYEGTIKEFDSVSEYGYKFCDKLE